MALPLPVRHCTHARALRRKRVNGTSLFFGDPLGDFVHRADLTAELFHVVVHQCELFRSALQASYRGGHGPHRLPHPAQEAGTLLPVRQQLLPEERVVSGDKGRSSRTPFREGHPPAQ